MRDRDHINHTDRHRTKELGFSDLKIKDWVEERKDLSLSLSLSISLSEECTIET